MSYNGIGLQSVRGSGTSGYVQTNLSTKSSSPKNYKHRQSIQKRQQIEQEIENCNEKRAQSRKQLKKHHRHRYIDVKCMELRDELEDMSEDEDVIVEKIEVLRKKLTAETTVSSDDYGENTSLDSSSAENTEETTTRDQANEQEIPRKSPSLDVASNLNKPPYHGTKSARSNTPQSPSRTNHTTTPPAGSKRAIDAVDRHHQPLSQDQTSPGQTSPESQVYSYEPRYKKTKS